MRLEKLRLKAQKHTFLLLSFVYFAFRLVNLTKLPIFNDEAIYLDWAWRMTHEPGYLYYSLYDGKQPLLMWLFGIAESMFEDPLFAGRFISVFFGFFTLFGVYRIGKTYFSKHVAITSALLYIVVPIFSFFDRQALMEASLSAIGVWSIWYFLRLQDEKRLKDAVKLGLVLGIGFFIKTTAAIFLFVILFLSFYLFFKKKNIIFKHIGIIFGTFFIAILFLLIQPKFWSSLSMNTRYGLAFSELIGFPILHWGTNLLSDIEILFFFLTPIVFIMSVFGIVFIFRKNGNTNLRLLAVYIILSLVFQVLLVRGVVPRYVVSFLPLLLLFSAFFFVSVVKKKITFMFGLVLLLLPPLFVTLVQIISPVAYFSFHDTLTKFSDISYVTGSTSGYGVSELIDSINSLQEKERKRIFVGIASNAGIPENALLTYFQKSKDVTITYFDGSLFGVNLDEYDCIATDAPVYFVSRGDQTPGIRKFLTHLTDIRNQYNQNYFGLWKLKTECTGKSLPITLQKT